MRDDADRVLLFQFEDPAVFDPEDPRGRDRSTIFWATPGERFFLARVGAADVGLQGLNAQEQSVYRDHRWWRLAELEATSEMVFPDALPEIVRRALAIA